VRCSGVGGLAGGGSGDAPGSFARITRNTLTNPLRKRVAIISDNTVKFTNKRRRFLVRQIELHIQLDP
jgi:hypothetical protein